MDFREFRKSGAMSLVENAVSDRRDSECRFLLNGDLVGMANQARFLKSRGMKVLYSNVYPGFATQEEFDQAITLLWEHRVPGWSNACYRDRLFELGVCTLEEFREALRGAVRKAHETHQGVLNTT